MTAAVDLREVTFRYPGTDEPAVSGLTAQVPAGEITLLTGVLGSGCSTLLQIMAGLAPHVTGGSLDGVVRTLGADPAAPEDRRRLVGRIGFLLPAPWTQLSGMSFTVAAEIAFGPANLGWDRDRIGGAVDRVLDLLDLRHLADRDPQTLSGGELQRVVFAAVLATEPEVLLLDEPVRELDSLSARWVTNLLAELAAGAAVVVATTSVEVLLGSAASLLLLDRGRLVASGPPAQVLGTADIVRRGMSTTSAGIALDAGLDGPFPLTAEELVRRCRP